MLKEILDTDVLIVGAGIAGLSLSYFLSKKDVNIIIIDKKEKIGYPIRDTGLVSNKIFNLLPVSKNIILKKYKKAIFYNRGSSFEVIARNSYMVLLNRPMLDIQIYEKIKEKINVLLKEELKYIKNRKIAVTNNRRINYKVIVDATGPFGLVRKLYGLKNIKNFVIGMEIHTKDIKENDIKIFLDKKFSKEYFGWVVGYDEYSLVGIIDKNLNINRFLFFIKRFGIKKYDYFYSDIIKNKPEKILSKDNMISVGESTGYLKQFSLGGIIYSIIQAKIASEIIYKYLTYNVSLKLYDKIIYYLFHRYLVWANFIRILLKNKIIFEILKTIKANKIVSNMDLDFYTIRAGGDSNPRPAG